jgi:hypothetical protein
MRIFLESRYHLKVKINCKSVFDPGMTPISERVATCRTGRKICSKYLDDTSEQSRVK